MWKSAITLAILAVAVLPAHANDSSAELSTGGLIFVQNPDVEMRSEDLFISAREVHVRYRFFNSSPRDVTVLVAFPMPEIQVHGPDEIISVPTEDAENFLAFATTVNGQPVATKVEQRVTAVGIDRTQLLRSLAVPLAPHLPTTNEALARLPADKWQDFLRLGIAEIEEYDTGRGMQKHLAPRWGLNTTFYWEQTFPGLAEVVIEHRYKPSVGETVQTALGAPNESTEPWYEEYKAKYCLDDEFLATVDRARRATNSRGGAPYSEQRIDYILRTGANWSGPIRDFRLVVDKGEPDSLVSFCGEDVKKISDTQFEMRRADYTPDGNLSVLILKRLQQ
ncbi:MAG: DUF4424 domain-containing protein [Xanthobacteraceae bacterium]